MKAQSTNTHKIIKSPNVKVVITPDAYDSNSVK